jgi:hypothetical protein
MKQEDMAGTHPPQALARSPDIFRHTRAEPSVRMSCCGWLVFIPDSSASGLGAGGEVGAGA